MKKFWITLAVTTTAFAQTQGQFVPHGPMGGGHEMIHFLGAEGGKPGQVVKGAPFSGQQLTTETQTLANGTHIQKTMTAQFYRDAEGRTREERTFSGLGPWNGGTPKTVITIFDPVAGVSYMLNPDKQTVVKMTIPASLSSLPKRTPSETSSEQVTKTDLGTQTIQGLSVQGTRTTRVIPVGQIGNDQELSVVNERWYSPDLQLNIQTKHTDPRIGEVDFQFQNISRTAPDASLFQPPASYTVTTRAMRGGMGMRNNAPPSHIE